MASDTQGKMSLIIGGAAVVVSLLYLAVETRVNTRAIQSAAYHSTTISFADMDLAVARDPGLSELWRKSIASTDTDGFTEQERFRFTFLAYQVFWRYQDFYNQYRHGAIEEELWTKRRNFARSTLELPVWQAWWQQTLRSNMFPTAFIDEINAAPLEDNIFLGVENRDRAG